LSELFGVQINRIRRYYFCHLCVGNSELTFKLQCWTNWLLWTCKKFGQIWNYSGTLSSCHKKATVALCFWTNHSKSSGCFFGFLTLPLNLLLVRSHQVEIIIVKRFIQRRKQRVRWGWELNVDHAVVIT